MDGTRKGRKMNNESIKKAVEAGREIQDGVYNDKWGKALQTLTQLAEDYLAVDGVLPKEQLEFQEDENPVEYQKTKGYNQARQDCLLAFSKRLEGVEELCNEVHGVEYLKDETDESYSPKDKITADILQNNNRVLAKAIKEKILGGEDE